jgi:hypothetical protein
MLGQYQENIARKGKVRNTQIILTTMSHGRILPVLTVRRREDNTETELTNYKHVKWIRMSEDMFQFRTQWPWWSISRCSNKELFNNKLISYIRSYLCNWKLLLRFLVTSNIVQDMIVRCSGAGSNLSLHECLLLTYVLGLYMGDQHVLWRGYSVENLCVKTCWSTQGILLPVQIINLCCLLLNEYISSFPAGINCFELDTFKA